MKKEYLTKKEQGTCSFFVEISGLEPELREPKSLVLAITPYLNCGCKNRNKSEIIQILVLDEAAAAGGDDHGEGGEVQAIQQDFRFGGVPLA